MHRSDRPAGIRIEIMSAEADPNPAPKLVCEI